MRTLTAAALCAAMITLSPAGSARAEEPERVVMKLDEFLRLYEEVKGRTRPEDAPRDHALSSARYRGEVVLDEGKPVSAVFTAKMRVEVIKPKGWARVPILPATVALQSAKIGTAEAPVVIENGFYTLVTDRRGAFDLDVSFAVGVTTSEGKSEVTFELAPSGATSAQLSVPAREDLDFTVAGARLTSDKVEGETRVVEASLPATGSLSIQWQREIPEAARQQSRVYSEVYTLVGLGDGLMRATTTIHNTILFRGVDQFQVKLPEGMTLLEVTGAGIRDWKQTQDGTLDVALNYAAEGTYSLKLEMERVIKESDKGLRAPIVTPQGVERSKGWVGVEARGNIEIGAGEGIKGATPVDVRSLPAAILGITPQPVLLGYKYLGAEVAVPLEVSYHDDIDVLVTLLDQTRARTMWTREGRRLTSVKYQIRNNRRQFLRLELPKGAELWSASVGGRAVQPARASDGRVMIPLVRSQSAGGALAAFEVEVVYVENGAPTADNGRGSFAARLPKPDAPSTYVAWTVFAPQKAKIIRRTVDGNLRHVDYLSNPIPEEDMNYIETETPQVAAQAAEQDSSGALGEGAVPVPVSLPLQGKEVRFEKLLALDETLEIEFGYRGLRR
ncbi:MAG: hypothetical protein H6713_29945 [Myxococcales bacterium]|nr:hypothetical protein [Myxococcales bacterium]MCB9754186.1 hypothetical protein [Myxococcales bacterium]